MTSNSAGHEQRNLAMAKKSTADELKQLIRADQLLNNIYQLLFLVIGLCC